MTDNRVECECGTLVLPCSMKAHLKTKKHNDLLQVMEKRRRDEHEEEAMKTPNELKLEAEIEAMRKNIAEMAYIIETQNNQIEFLTEKLTEKMNDIGLD